jgi:hypothetical protein
MNDAPTPSLFQSKPPPEIGGVIKAFGVTEAEARSGKGCLGIVLGLVVAAGAWAGTQFIPFGIRMDNTQGFAISTAIALVLGAVVHVVARSGKAEEVVTFLAEHGLARMAASGGVARPLAIVPFSQVANVQLQMTRYGSHGINLRKVWTFTGADGRELIALRGTGAMNRMSADPAQATPSDGGWAFAEAAVAQWRTTRAAAGR